MLLITKRRYSDGVPTFNNFLLSFDKASFSPGLFLSYSSASKAWSIAFLSPNSNASKLSMKTAAINS